MTSPAPVSSLPLWQGFLRPTLEVLGDRTIRSRGGLAADVLDHMQLTDDQRAEQVNSGAPRAVGRFGWAISDLVRAGLAFRPERAKYQITASGLDYLATHAGDITEADLRAIPAYQAYVPKRRASDVATDTDELPSFWFAGAFFSGEEPGDFGTGDQTERFIAEGRWYNGNPGKYIELVKSMQVGERIAIKAAYTRKLELPFDNRGNRVSVMAIKATGTITRNHGDGYAVDVTWDPVEPVREWYFFTNQQTVWRVKPGEWNTDALIAFAFDGDSQNYDAFRNAPYWREKFGDAAPVVDDSAEETVEEETTGEFSYSIDSIIDEGCFVPRDTLAGYVDALTRKKNLILQGPPGTGKTWLAKRLGYALIGSEDRKLLRALQFHPSVSYEDFVRGWRPSEAGRLTLTDGIFLDVINAARADPGHSYVLVIEEINRANLAQVFGELLTLLEADKRKASEALTLSYSRPDEEPTFLPDNLYIIGTMNLADRSLAIVDFALRRRFAFADLQPQFNDRWRSWVSERNGVPAQVLSAIGDRMGALNTAIRSDRSLGDQYQIGHSFLTPAGRTQVADPVAWVHQVVDQEVKPLLSEYWFDDPSRVDAEIAALRASV